LKKKIVWVYNRGVHDSFSKEAISSRARNRSTAADFKFSAELYSYSGKSCPLGLANYFLFFTFFTELDLSELNY
jgi:hypothetical protein